MSKYPRVILMLGLAVLLLACAATVAGARVTYKTSTPILSRAPAKDKPFTCSGTFSPKSTTKSRATIKIILWMKYGDRMGSHATPSRPTSPGAPGTRATITDPDEGLAWGPGGPVSRRQEGLEVGDPVVRREAVEPVSDPEQERVTGRRSWVRDALLLVIVIAVAAPAIVLVTRALTGDGDMRSVESATASGSPVAVASPTGPPQTCSSCWVDKGGPAPRSPARRRWWTACRSSTSAL